MASSGMSLVTGHYLNIVREVRNITGSVCPVACKTTVVRCVLKSGSRRECKRSLLHQDIGVSAISDMHKVHVDKKGKVDTGSIATQISTAGAPKDHAIKEVPGILEEGKVFFFYRPRKGLQEVHSLGDIQRFYMVLLPLSRPAPARLIVVGRKHLPDRGQRFWAAVVAVAPTMDEVLQGLGPKASRSGTSQARLTPAARLVGEGIYVLFDHGREVDLLYELEIPMYPHEAQEELGIYKTGELTIQVKNPYRPSPPGFGLGKKPEYPKELQRMFCEGPPGGYAWIPPKNPALLDFEHAEFVLIGRSPDIERKNKSLKELLDKAVKQDLGTELLKHEDASEEDCAMLDRLKRDISADSYGIDIHPAIDGVLE